MLYSEDEAGRVQPVPAIWFIDEAGNRYRGCSIWHMPAAWVTDEAGNRYERYRVFPGPAEEYWPEFRLLEEPEGKITAIEVEALVFNILRTDRPREVETRSYTSTYNPLNWVIELPLITHPPGGAPAPPGGAAFHMRFPSETLGKSVYRQTHPPGGFSSFPP